LAADGPGDGEPSNAAEHLDEADAVERPFLYRKIEFFDPMLTPEVTFRAAAKTAIVGI
jgi:hypothetical protein